MMQMETVMPISLCLFIMIFECKSSQPFFLFPFFEYKNRLREARELGRRQTSTESSSSNEDAFARRLRYDLIFPRFFLILIIRQVFATNGLKAMRGCNMWAKKDIPTWVFL